MSDLAETAVTDAVGRPTTAAETARGRWAWALCLVLFLAACHSGAATADAPDPRNRVNFAVQRAREVANDQVTATIGVTHEDADPAKLADRINRDMSWALEIARSRTAVKVKSGGYQTQPIHDREKGRVRHWRGSQDIVLESTDTQAVTDLLGELQARLQLRSIAFGVSDERRRGVEDELIDEVLSAFRERSERVRKRLGASGYGIVKIHLGTGSPPTPRPMRALAHAEATTVAAPAFEAGSSRVHAVADGMIELEF